MSVVENHIYLASRSLRRRELLKQIGVNFEILLLRDNPTRGVDVNEDPLADEPPENYVSRIARAKAEEGWRQMQKRRLRAYPLLAADTTVALEDAIIGKPLQRENAIEILTRLSGKQHRVLSAVAMIHRDRLELTISASFVTFRELTDSEIKRYVATGEAVDKAGAYAVQGRAAAFISKLNGSYSGVMGLPLFETSELLSKFGVHVA